MAIAPDIAPDIAPGIAPGMDPANYFEQATAMLPPEQRESLRAAYDRRAKNATTAFLTGYFLGLLGAHWMYLGEWGRAAPRLAISALATLVALAGLLAVVPATFALPIVGTLLLAGLIWEAIDLARLDRYVNARNLSLADDLIAVADISPVVDQRGNSPAGIGTDDIAQARRWADEAAPVGAFGAFAADPWRTDARHSTASVPTVETESYEHQPADAFADSRADTVADTVPEWPAIPPSDAASVPAASAALDPEADTLPRLPAISRPPASPEPAAASPAPMPAPTAPSPQPAMKRIRVRRKILVDGEVVGEQVIEELVPVDTDTLTAAAALQARLARMTPEEIAALAHLPPGVAVEFRDKSRGDPS